MTALSELRLSTPDPADKACLTTWLQEWAVACQLDPAPPASEGHRPGAPVAPFHRVIRPADIRLLSPALSPLTRSRPVHVLVLENHAPEYSIVVPFSRFATPALPGELALETDIPALRVVCAWNRCRVCTTVLQASWHITTLPADAFAECRELSAAANGTPTPARLLDRVGPPLTHPLDPRHRYIDGETGLCQALELLTEAATLVYPPPPDETSLDKAAEPPPDYDA